MGHFTVVYLISKPLIWSEAALAIVEASIDNKVICT